VHTPGQQGQRQREVRTFGTTTAALLELADWLMANGTTHAAIESSGVYWKPVFHVLESVCEVVLVNPAHVKALPGRKTDVQNCECWRNCLNTAWCAAASFPRSRSVSCAI
jgi:transposase